MAKLSLSIAANDLPVVQQRQVVSYLLLRAEILNRLGEHLHVKGHRVGSAKQEVPLEVLGLLVRVVEDDATELWITHDDLEAIPPLLELFHASHLVEAWLGCKLRILLDQTSGHVKLFLHILRVEHILALIHVEVALRALGDQKRVHDSALDATTKDLRVELLVVEALGHLFLIQHFATFSTSLVSNYRAQIATKDQ